MSCEIDKAIKQFKAILSRSSTTEGQRKLASVALVKLEELAEIRDGESIATVVAQLAKVDTSRVVEDVKPWDVKGTVVWGQRVTGKQAQFIKGYTAVNNFGNPFTTGEFPSATAIDSMTASGDNNQASVQYYNWLMTGTIPSNYDGDVKLLNARREWIISNLGKIRNATVIAYKGTARGKKVSHINALIKASEELNTGSTGKIGNPLVNAGVNPTDMAGHAAKDIAMAEIATQFIGTKASDNVAKSSTELYKDAFGDKANTGNYTADDIVMVSGSGPWRGVTNADITNRFESFYKPLLNKAITANAKLVVGSANGTDTLIIQHLKDNGYKVVFDKKVGFNKAVVATAAQNTQTGIDISTKSADELGKALTNVHYASAAKPYSVYSIVPSDKTLKSPGTFSQKWFNRTNEQSAFDVFGHSVEGWYKANNSQAIGMQQGAEATAYDVKLMQGLIEDKLTQHPDLVSQINERGGKAFLEKSTHSMGYGRWSSKGDNLFVKTLIDAYNNVSAVQNVDANVLPINAGPEVEIKEPKYEIFKDVYANSDQRNAIDTLGKFLERGKYGDFTNSSQTSILLKGRGGTGKTSIISKVLQNSGVRKSNVHYVTPTNKATKVIQQMALRNDPRTDSVFATVAQELSYVLVGNSLQKKTDKRDNIIKPLMNGGFHKGQAVSEAKVVVVDESSMLTKTLQKELEVAAKKYGVKIIYMGDNVQLAPIADGDLLQSNVFNDHNSADTRVELSKRMRQSEDSGILPITDVLADAVESMVDDTGTKQTPTSQHKAIKFIDTNSSDVQFKPRVGSTIKGFVTSVKSNPTSTRWIMFNNNQHAEGKKLTTAVRNALFGESAKDPYVTGEQLYVDEALYANDEEVFSTGDELTVKSVGVEKVESFSTSEWDNTIKKFASKYYELPAVKLQVTDNLAGGTYEVFVKTASTEVALAKLPVKSKNAINSKFMVSSPAYVLTSHKSQGSTYETVYADIGNIFAHGSSLDKLKSAYVATSRPSKKLIMVGVPSNMMSATTLKATNAQTYEEVIATPVEIATIKSANDKFKSQHANKFQVGDEFHYDPKTGMITVMEPTEDIDSDMVEVYTAHEIRHALTYDWISKNENAPKVKYLKAAIAQFKKDYNPEATLESSLLKQRMDYASGVQLTDDVQVAELVAILSAEPNIRKEFIKAFPQEKKYALNKILNMIKAFLAGHALDMGQVINTVDSIADKGTIEYNAKTSEEHFNRGLSAEAIQAIKDACK